MYILFIIIGNKVIIYIYLNNFSNYKIVISLTNII
jgi:hypothetical protein